MAPRLLSLLSKIESSLAEQRSPAVNQPVQRAVSYQKGLARMTFAAGGAITLQCFSLADGQMCIKAGLSWPGSDDTVVQAIYPHGKSHDWAASAESVALAWMAGPVTAPLPAAAGLTAPVATDRLAAVS